VDLILTPTAGRHPTIAAMQADPIRLNTELGYYTNFMNLLDYAAVAVPAAFRPTACPSASPCSPPPTRTAPCWSWPPAGSTAPPCPWAPPASPCRRGRPASGVPDGMLRVAVCGAHLSGLPLNWQLTQRKAA
jgi:allophanate hydrolase